MKNKCIFTMTNQRRVEGIINSRFRDPIFYDDLTDYFDPIDIEGRSQHMTKLAEREDTNFFTRWLSVYKQRRMSGKNLAVIDLWSDFLFSRITKFTETIEFSTVMDVPPDFHVQYSILNFHLWLVVSRLKDFKDQKVVRHMIKSLNEQFRLYSNFHISEIHIKKKNDFVKDLESFMRLNRNTFDKHFRNDPRTSANPYYKADALVWSTIFFEKVDRYDPRVYRFAEYAVNLYKYFSSLPLEDLKTGVFNYDAFRIRGDFHKKLTDINPPLSSEEFEAELDSDEPVKKFFYTYDDPDFQMPLDAEKDQIIDRRFAKVQEVLGRTYQKYRTLDSYDYFSEKEDKQKEEAKKAQKYVWNNQPIDRDLMFFAAEEVDTLKQYHKKEEEKI